MTVVDQENRAHIKVICRRQYGTMAFWEVAMANRYSDAKESPWLIIESLFLERYKPSE